MINYVVIGALAFLVVILFVFLVIEAICLLRVKRHRLVDKVLFLIILLLLTVTLFCILHYVTLPYGVYVFFAHVYEILISNIGITAVIAAAGFGLNAIKSDFGERSKLLIFFFSSVAISVVLILSACYFTGDVSFISFGEDCIYRGQTLDSKAEGKGTVYDRKTDDIVYSGTLKNNQYDGQGTLYQKRTYNDGTQKYELAYIGEFKNNQYNGHGIEFKFADDHNFICYVGDFKDGLYSGEGTWYLYCVDYEGDEIDLSEVSERIQIDTSHLMLRYQGQFANNKYNGTGTTYDLLNGRKYKEYNGPFIDNQYSGANGTLYFPEGPERYVGDFKDGQYHGYGTEYVIERGNDEVVLSHVNSRRWYEGYFAYGRYEGEGTLFNSDGIPIQIGIFSNGELVSGLKNVDGNLEPYAAEGYKEPDE